MADHTKIEWTDATWNPVTGCSVVSPGCTNCYAMKLAGTRLKNLPSRAGLTRETKAGPVWNGTVRFNEAWLTQPLQWKRPRMVFVCAHGDLFHEDVPDTWIDPVFAVMALAPQHTFQVLTKRAARMRAYMDMAAGRIADATIALRRTPLAVANGMGPSAVVPLPHIRPGAPWWPLPNVWLGVSAEDHLRADDRIPDLLATPAAIRFVSAEPLLASIRFDRIDDDVDTFEDCGGHPDPHWPSDTHDATWLNALTGQMEAEARAPDGTRRGSIDVGLRWKGGKLDWIIVGGENGPRMMRAEWAQAIRDQCAAANVPFFFKQWGTHLPAGQIKADGRPWTPGCGSTLHATKGITGRLLDGVEHNGMPRTA